jgi:hypothetical protein
VLVWDGLPAHRSAKMRTLIAARRWLRVYQLPGYAPELNPTETFFPRPLFASSDRWSIQSVRSQRGTSPPVECRLLLGLGTGGRDVKDCDEEQ